MVITLALLGFPLTRPYAAFDVHWVITSVLIAISTANVLPIETAGRVVRVRLAAWISVVLALYSDCWNPSTDIR